MKTVNAVIHAAALAAQAALHFVVSLRLQNRQLISRQIYQEIVYLNCKLFMPR